MDPQDIPAVRSIDQIIDSMMNAAFERAARGGGGRTPDEVMDLIEERLKRAREGLPPEREAQLKRLTSLFGVNAEEYPDPAIRRVNAKVSEWEMDGSIPPEKQGQRYRDRTIGDALNGRCNPPPDPGQG